MTNTLNVGQRERATQDRVVALLRDQLGYQYGGNRADQSNTNIDQDALRSYLLRRGHDEATAGRAVDQLVRTAADVTRDDYDRNRDVYQLLRYGVRVRPGHGELTQTVHLIDWADPEANDFVVAEEVSVLGKRPGTTKRPDVVLYVNGIALVVLELKRSTVSISEGIRQNLDNQAPEFIPHFFSTVQAIMAGNDTQGLWYGAIKTPEKYFLRWKEDGPVANELDRSLLQICGKARLLELVHDFVVFDMGVKKLCRPNQYFGVRAAQQYASRREGGILWHTQGSGKTLTMVWLAKWLKENVRGSRVLIVTDRKDLDEQVEGVFKGVGEEIRRTTSGADLITVLNDASPWLVCSLIHKFAKSGEAGSANIPKYLEELREALPAGFAAKGEVFVFVDECHRSQSNLLHASMKEILPEATFIGFTGTPLLKSDRARSLEVFGPYIHTYRFDEAVRDGVVVDLRYEARDIDQRLTSATRVDQWFAAKTAGLNDVAKAQLKKRWGTLQKVLSSKSRLGRIVEDIVLDMSTRDRLMSGRGNAILVAGSIYEACIYYELFQSTELKSKCGIVSSYVPTPGDIKGEETGEGETVPRRQYDVYCQMIADWFKVPPEDAVGKAEKYEEQVKHRFVHEPARMKLLIVVDKLLTGFDAPPATYLYIDKAMRDHGLFQAICRVNRLDGDDKDYGYIVDYKDLFQSLRAAVHDYTSGAFDAYDPAEVGGLLKGRAAEARKDVEGAQERLRALLEDVDPPKGTEECLRYFCSADGSSEELKANEPRRVALYQAVASFVRAVVALAPDYQEAGYTDAELTELESEARRAENLRQEVKLASGDYIDLKQYEPAMRHLLDSYISADPSKVLTDFDDLSFVEMLARRGPAAVDELPEGVKKSKRAVAETIKNNVRRVIVNERPINPRYFDEMSRLLEELVRQRRQESLDYQAFLELVAELAKKVTDPASGAEYPGSISSPGLRAIYDHLDGDEQHALKVDEALRSSCQDGWATNRFKRRRVRQALVAALGEDGLLVDELLELAEEQGGY